MRWQAILPVILILALPGCYSFKGFSISEDLNTFDVLNFKSTAFNAPPTIQQTFQEQLKIKVSRESRLVLDSDNPDITFSGSVSRFSVTAVAPESGAVTAANRLEIAISINYENLRDEEDNWTQTFSHFIDFPSDQNLLDVQDELIDQIYNQIIEDIFNKAFTNW